MKYKVLVIGSGLSAATITNKFAIKQKKRVLVIDRRNHNAGKFFDDIDSYFGYNYEPLKHRSLKLEEIELNTNEFQPASVLNYPSLDRPLYKDRRIQAFLQN